MKLGALLVLLLRPAQALVGEVTSSATTAAPAATLPHDLNTTSHGLAAFEGIQLGTNATEGIVQDGPVASPRGEGLEAIAGLNSTIDETLSIPPPPSVAASSPASPAASSALPTVSTLEDLPAAVPPLPEPVDPPIAALPDLIPTDAPSPPEFLSFNEWKEKYAVLPDASARRAKKAAQRSRQDAATANGGGGDASFDGDGLDFGSLFASEDGGVHKVGYEGEGGDKHVESVQLRKEGSVGDGVASNDSQLPPAEAALADLSIGTSASPIQPLGHTGSGDSLDPLVPLKDRSNYALFECAAMVHRSSPQSKGASSILVEKKDRYMLTPCSADPKFVELELCDEIKIDTIVLANFEFFSSMFKHFSIKVSVNYPGRADEWHDLGTFRARNIRGIQAFHPKSILGFYRYMRIDFVSHYGSEFYCPVSLLRVYGTTQMDAYRKEAEIENEQKVAAAAAALSADEADEEDALDAVETVVEEVIVVESPTTVQQANTTTHSLTGSTNATITAMCNKTAVETSSQVTSSSTLVERSIELPSELESVSTATHTSASTLMATPTPTSTVTLAPSLTLEITSAPSNVVTTATASSAITSTTIVSSVSNPKDIVNSTSSAPSQNLTTSFTHTDSSTSESETISSASTSTTTTSVTEVLATSSQIVPSTVPSTVFMPESTPPPTATQATTSSELSPSSTASPPNNVTNISTSVDVLPTALNSTTTTLASDPPVPSNSTTSRASSSESSSPSPRATPSVESTEPRRPPPPMPPPVQPQPGESIYGTIMKRLTSLEHNQTLSMHYIEAQSAMLREAFMRVEKRLAVFEGGRGNEEALIRQAIVEMDKHRMSLDRDRVALALQLNILSQEVLFEKRLGVALLIGLLALFVFVGLTRGSSTTPFLQFVPPGGKRYRKETQSSEDRGSISRGEEDEERVRRERSESTIEANRRLRIRGSPIVPRTPSIKHHSSTPSKGTPRRLYGPTSTLKPTRPLRPFTPTPQRAGSLPSEEASSSALAAPATDLRRRTKGVGGDFFTDDAAPRARRYSELERPAKRMERRFDDDVGPPSSSGIPNGLERDGRSMDMLEVERDERAYMTLSGSEDDTPMVPNASMEQSPPKAVVSRRPVSSAGPFGGSGESPVSFPPRSTLPQSPPEPRIVAREDKGLSFLGAEL